MIKKSIYPKTKRVQTIANIQITEKVDGSNLTLFKKDGKLYIATRSYIYSIDEIESIGYKGLPGWLMKNAKTISNSLLESRAICGEWIGMGALSYDGVFDNRFLMFAIAIVTDDLELIKINYELENFKYAFENEQYPECIGGVPLVAYKKSYPFIEQLDALYKNYVEYCKRDVEGFIIHFNGEIRKYVRMKNGTLTEHKEKGE